MLLLIALLKPALAHAVCLALQLKNLGGTVEFGQDPSPTINFQVQGLGVCTYYATIDDAGAASYTTRSLTTASGGSIPVSVCLDSACNRMWKAFPEVSSGADVLAGAFNSLASQSTPFSYFPRLGAADYQPFGDYNANFTVRLYEGTWDGLRILRDTQSVRFHTYVNKRVDLSLVGTGSAFDPSSTSKVLDFGILTAGKEMGFDLLVKYNAGYRVKLSSAHNGVMVNAAGDSSVPYNFYLGNSVVNLASSQGSPVAVTEGSGTSPAAGLRFPGRVQIGSIAGAKAGAYQDNVTITVTTTE